MKRKPLQKLYVGCEAFSRPIKLLNQIRIPQPNRNPVQPGRNLHTIFVRVNPVPRNSARSRPPSHSIISTFDGNEDHSEVKVNKLEPAITCQYLRIVPVKTFQNLEPALRCEFYGYYHSL